MGIILIVSIFFWVACFEMDSGRSGIRWGIRGGGDDEPAAPAAPVAPTPQETTREAIQAQIDALPRILQSQKEFGPQFTQLSLDSIKKFGPEFADAALALEAEFGPEIAEQTKIQQDILDPSRAAGSDAIKDYLDAGPEGLTEEDIRAIEQSSRSAAASRGLSQSGFSARDEILRNFGARQQLKSRYLDVALSASGRLPAAAGSTTSANPLAAGPGSLVQNVSPSEFFGAQASNNSFNSSIFGTQADIYKTQMSNRSPGAGALIGSIVGTGVGALAGGFGAGLGQNIGSRLGGGMG